MWVRSSVQTKEELRSVGVARVSSALFNSYSTGAEYVWFNVHMWRIVSHGNNLWQVESFVGRERDSFLTAVVILRARC